MDALPPELIKHPNPVISFLGVPEITIKLMEAVKITNAQSGGIECTFLHLPLEHQFPIKKEIRERTSSFPTRYEKDFGDAIPKGILKSNWMQKHHELLPAVCVPVFEIDPRFNSSDWIIHETIICNEIDRLKQSLSGKNVKFSIDIFSSQLNRP